MGLFDRWRRWRVRRLAAGPPIAPGAWCLDLGMPTDRAVRIKQAYEMQRASRD